MRGRSLTRLTRQVSGSALFTASGVLLFAGVLVAFAALRLGGTLPWPRHRAHAPVGGSGEATHPLPPVDVAPTTPVLEAADAVPRWTVGEWVERSSGAIRDVALSLGLAAFAAAMFMALAYPVVFPPSLAAPAVTLDSSEAKVPLDGVIVLQVRGTFDKSAIEGRLVVSPRVALDPEDLNVAHSVALPWLSATGWATTTVTMNPHGERLFEPETEYTVSLMRQTVTFETITVPRVLSVDPPRGSSEVDVWQPVRISSNEPVAWDKSMFSIAPPADIVVAATGDGRTISITPTGKPWQNSTFYRVGIADEISDRHGRGMAGDFATTFSTVAPIAVSASGSEQSRPTDAALEFAFDRAPDQKETEASFRISPPADGIFAWADPTVLIWTPASPLSHSTDYVVSIGGEGTVTNPVDPGEWAFHTADPPVSVSIQGGSQSPATLRAVPSGGLSSYEYRWSTGAAGDVVTVTVPQGRAWDVSVTVTSGDQTATAYVRVYGPPLPPPPPPPPLESVGNPGGGNKIVLTFDDAGSMSAIMDVLARYDAKAIFFPTGYWARAYPAVIDRAVQEGHLVCNHSSSHADLTTLSAEGVRGEILGGVSRNCDLFRPPFGAYNYTVGAVAAELGYQAYMWDIDTRDWARTYPGGDQEILNIVMAQAFPGAVVLMHLQVANTLAVLPTMIERLQDAGYVVSW